jgi:hypothetical protein
MYHAGCEDVLDGGALVDGAVHDVVVGLRVGQVGALADLFAEQEDPLRLVGVADLVLEACHGPQQRHVALLHAQQLPSPNQLLFYFIDLFIVLLLLFD